MRTETRPRILDVEKYKALLESIPVGKSLYLKVDIGDDELFRKLVTKFDEISVDKFISLYYDDGLFEVGRFKTITYSEPSQRMIHAYNNLSYQSLS